jgi:hypothetical protein
MAAAIRRHWGLVALLAVAAALRVVALIAISPGIWFSDSNVYVRSAATGTLSTIRPVGYSLFVAPFYALRSAGALIIAQHAIGLAIAAGLYALLVRRGVPRGLALLGAAPAALDLYLVVVEHTVMAETIFHAAIVGVVALLLCRDTPGLLGTGAAGLLLGYVAVVRSVGVPFLAVFVLYLLVRRLGWRHLGVFLVGWALVAGGYAALYDHQHGSFAFSGSSGRFLYGKVAPFADCAKLTGVPAKERRFCPDPRHRKTPNDYTWGTDSPIYRATPDAVRDFALRVVRQQTGQYLHVVAAGVVHYFKPGHHIGLNDYSVHPWEFPANPAAWSYPGYRGPIRDGVPWRQKNHPITEPNRDVGRMVSTNRVDRGASRFLHDLQKVLYTPGPLFGLCVVLVVLALVLRAGAARLRLDAALLAAAALVALTVTQALSVFSYRYGFTLIILLPPAAALAATALRQRLRPGQDP